MPGEVIPGPRGARSTPARVLVAKAETRAGLSALLGQPGPTGRAGTVGRAAETSAAPAPCPAPQTLSCDQARPGLAGLVPQRRGHLALPQDPTARRAAGGATPPLTNSRPASPAAARLHSAPRRPLAPLGLPGNRGSSATPGGPPAERARRAAGAAAATCERCRPLPRTPL